MEFLEAGAVFPVRMLIGWAVGGGSLGLRAREGQGQRLASVQLKQAFLCSNSSARPFLLL